MIALGEAELAAGRTAAARRTLALVAAEQQLLGAAGVDTDVELAVFEADHGDPRRAVALARRGWDAAPSTRSADALGWALTRAGDPRGRPALGAPRAAARVGRPALARARRASRRSPPAVAPRAGGTCGWRSRHGLDGWPWQAQRVRRALHA